LPAPTPPDRGRLFRLFLVSAILLWVVGMANAFFEATALKVLFQLTFACFVLLASAWILRAVWRRFFWSVGRRLAFSYVLVGVLPLGLISLLGLVASYLLGGFLLGHLYRDAADGLRDRLETAALARLEAGAEPAPVPFAGLAGEASALRFADYRRGRRTGGDESAPAEWPAWLATAQASRRDASSDEGRRPFVARADGGVTVAALAGDAERGALVWLDGDLDALLRERSRTWVQLFRSDDPRKLPVTRIQVGGKVLVLRGLWIRRSPEETAEYFRLNPPRRPERPTWIEEPVILWMERAEGLRSLATGATVAEGVSVSLAASPRGLFSALLSASEQTDSTAWLALAGVGVLLAEIWAVAAGVAVFMIYGLSRAVNRLSRATDAVGRGDFSVRIPVRRRDQVGDLQRSFNAMTEHLSELVETAAQKEALDKELALARQVQQSLLPDVIGERAGLEIATFFEPSSAIGGDYFDFLDRPDGGLAVVIADVAGHGLAAGLRMAMVKSALELMAEEGRASEEIVQRLHRLLKRRPGERSFVTLAFADLDPRTGTFDLTNAGHPPCYVLRGTGEVEEILAPGMPLGSLPGVPGRVRLRLAAGEAVVFLSDGIVECRDARGELFGFDRVRACLAGPPARAERVLERLLSAMRAHSGDDLVEDDRTVVVVAYRPAGATDGAPSGVSPSRT
jgi:serine phosphatase RsbU (regulator of sigma subunit)